MSRVFNSIRKKLLSQNRLAKYLPYALGEILLVVIGILIALQIDNWNDLRKQDIAETAFIKGVQIDLQQDKEYISLVLQLINKKIEAYIALETIESESSDFISETQKTDSLLKVYFVGQRTFYPVSGSFQSAVAGNEINKFKNKEFTAALIKLYNSTYSRLIDNGVILDERWSWLSKLYTHERRTADFNLKTRAQLSEVLDDMYYNNLQLEWYKDNLEDTQKAIERLLEKGKGNGQGIKD